MLLKYLVEQDPSFKIRSINLEGIITTNPSIAVHRNSLVFVARRPGYMLFQSNDDRILFNDHKQHFFQFNNDVQKNGGHSLSTSYLGSINPDSLEVLSYQELNLPVGPYREDNYWRGVEDIKIISWEDTLYGIGASREFNNEELVQQMLLTFDENSQTILIDSLPNQNRLEKNWMPVEDRPKVFMRWPNPGQVINLSEDNLQLNIIAENKSTPVDEEWRGSGQLITVGDNYLALVHISYRWKENSSGFNRSYYKHRFVLYNKNFNLLRASKQFTFFDGSTEFGNGIVLDNDRLFISFGLQDTGAFICSTNINNIMEFIYA